jgi:predicted ATP-grasp superfamily ATP-dependent carboligase
MHADSIDTVRHVLVAGVSTRAAAESAVRAGFAVTALDAFGDLDQAPGVRALSLPRDFGRPFSAAAAARAARGLGADAVSYVSGFENHPRAVAALASGRRLWGNAPSVVRHVRSPLRLSAALRERGLAAPAVVINTGEGRAGGGEWLIKPLASAGGHRIRPWQRGERLPRGYYLQQRLEGTPGSAVFVADGRRASLLAVTRQLVGEATFGAAPFGYCGSMLPAARAGDALFERARTLASAVAEAFELVGVNTIDFIVHGDEPAAIEVNPRWSGSMELIERACGLSVFGAHADACARGVLPAHDIAVPTSTVFGKAIVFARADVIVRDPAPWLDDPAIRDVPHPGESIGAGRPVCTVFASGHDEAACQQALERRAAAVYETLEEWATPDG